MTSNFMGQWLRGGCHDEERGTTAQNPGDERTVGARGNSTEIQRDLLSTVEEEELECTVCIHRAKQGRRTNE